MPVQKVRLRQHILKLDVVHELAKGLNLAPHIGGLELCAMDTQTVGVHGSIGQGSGLNWRCWIN